MELKLSKKMKEAIEALKTYGEYELWELRHWNTWRPVIHNINAPSIRTDTMKGLIKRGLVETSYDKNRTLWKFTAKLVKSI